MATKNKFTGQWVAQEFAGMGGMGGGGVSKPQPSLHLGWY